VTGKKEGATFPFLPLNLSLSNIFVGTYFSKNTILRLRAENPHFGKV